MNTIEQLIRPDLRQFKQYSSARKEAQIGDVWLNANELPWDRQQTLAVSGLNRYPQQQPQQLQQQLADYYQVGSDQLLLSRGSDEAIDLLIRLCCEPGRDKIMISTPTFGMYAVSAQLQGADIIEVAMPSPAFIFNKDAIIQAWQPAVKLVFLCSPNNPTGELIKSEAVVAIAAALAGKALVVVDEAYIEFADEVSISRYIDEYDNLAVLRTLSKAFGLAGVRIGGLLANTTLVAWLSKILPPYPLSALSIQAACAALTDVACQQRADDIKVLNRERERLQAMLNELAIVDRVWPSQANFILVKFNQDVKTSCEQQGIILRDMQSKIGLEFCLRISIGTPEQNAMLIDKLYQL